MVSKITSICHNAYTGAGIYNVWNSMCDLWSIQWLEPPAWIYYTALRSVIILICLCSLNYISTSSMVRQCVCSCTIVYVTIYTVYITGAMQPFLKLSWPPQLSIVASTDRMYCWVDNAIMHYVQWLTMLLYVGKWKIIFVNFYLWESVVSIHAAHPLIF